MATNKLKDRFDDLEKLAQGAGLKHYPVNFFEVPVGVIYEVASYGLPTRYSHWSFGRVYEHQKTYGEMGMSKIYELILNNNPSYAFLDKSNPDTINLLIAAHCFGHADFFANNIMFRRCGEVDMVNQAKQHAEIIDGFRRDYGDDEVDSWLDVALALERHIDVYRGLSREKYEERHVEYKETKRDKWDGIAGKQKPLIQKLVKGLYIPPHPEKDFLWFLSNYANLEPWQQAIFDIVRRESYYFYPQYRTKIMNEGWASYFHAELMRQYSFGDDNDYGVKGIKHPLTAEEHLDFAAAHEKVVQPGLKMHLKVELPEFNPRTGQKTGTTKRLHPQIAKDPQLFHAATRTNPYYIGFRIFRDIKSRWDGYFEKGYMENEWGDRVPVTVNGDQKIREVMQSEDDVSFFRNYLTDELVEELHLFVYGSTKKYKDALDVQEDIRDTLDDADEINERSKIGATIIENKTLAVRTKDTKEIINTFAKVQSNYGVPSLVIRRVDESGLLRIEHLLEDDVNCDLEYATQVLKYVHRAWGREVELIRKDPVRKRTHVLKFSGSEPELDYLEMDYPESVEKDAAPSSW